ncbi:hypothetical protein [Verrucomicrobium sp. BvORR106]|uniref:hypothetical protein n=1 Tax=Verrucomicrobium sp. BvORR106 TaxID=1403819 RepID=UPI002240FFC0|nr:hypothetical protein [Verrucomicrobium sp. BvORR106]
MLNLFRRFFQATGNRPSVDALCCDEVGRPVLDRDDEWWLEVNGERIALLRDRRSVEMFWSSFLVVPVTENPVWLRQLGERDFWLSLTPENCTFRNRSRDVVSSHPFAAQNPFVVPGRVLMRRL